MPIIHEMSTDLVNFVSLRIFLILAAINAAVVFCNGTYFNLTLAYLSYLP